MFDMTLRYLNLIILPHPVSIIHVTNILSPPRTTNLKLTLSFRVLMYLCLKQTRYFEYTGVKGIAVRTVFDQNHDDACPWSC